MTTPDEDEGIDEGETVDGDDGDGSASSGQETLEERYASQISEVFLQKIELPIKTMQSQG